ncbi:MAG: hypothetical protein ACM3QS_02705, partial [Bacteroidota bacterium]
MRPRFYLNTLVLVMLLFLAAGAGQGAQAAGSEGVSAKLIKPASIVTIRGAVSGLVGQLWTLDQSGTVDDPAKYVLFSTPLTVYDGYRTYKLPTTISVGDITSVRIKVNYKGPANITQAWTWYLYDWVLSKWVKAGDNMGAVAGLWKVLNFTVTVNPTHYVNNVTHQMRLRLVSSNAGGNAKLDYEAISVQYNNACADPLGCVTIRPGDPIHIGYLLALTGNNAALGLEERRGGTI